MEETLASVLKDVEHYKAMESSSNDDVIRLDLQLADLQKKYDQLEEDERCAREILHQVQDAMGYVRFLVNDAIKSTSVIR